MNYSGSLQKAPPRSPQEAREGNQFMKKTNCLLEKIIILVEEGNYFSKVVNYKILCLLKNGNGTFSNKHIPILASNMRKLPHTSIGKKSAGRIYGQRVLLHRF